jgi:hypothetical protein
MKRLLLVLALTIAASSPAPVQAALSADSLLAAVRDARGDTIPTNAVLTDIAERRAAEIQTDLSHNGAGAPWPWGELLAVNSFNDSIAVSSAIAGWLASPDHKAVLLGDWTAVGVGVSEVGDSNYFAVVFAVIPTGASFPTPPPTDTAP